MQNKNPDEENMIFGMQIKKLAANQLLYIPSCIGSNKCGSFIWVVGEEKVFTAGRTQWLKHKGSQVVGSSKGKLVRSKRYSSGSRHFPQVQC